MIETSDSSHLANVASDLASTVCSQSMPLGASDPFGRSLSINGDSRRLTSAYLICLAFLISSVLEIACSTFSPVYIRRTSSF